MEERVATDRPSRRNLRGTREQLAHGGWVRVLPRIENFRFHDKRRRLEAELRAARDLPIDADLKDILNGREMMDLIIRSDVGTVVTEWGDFDDGDGGEWPCRRPDGSLDEDAGYALLTTPGVDIDYMAAVRAVDARFARDVEIAIKNSQPPSDGSSDTEA